LKDIHNTSSTFLVCIPILENVDTTSDENKLVVSDKFVVNSCYLYGFSEVVRDLVGNSTKWIGFFLS